MGQTEMRSEEAAGRSTKEHSRRDHCWRKSGPATTNGYKRDFPSQGPGRGILVTQSHTHFIEMQCLHVCECVFGKSLHETIRSVITSTKGLSLSLDKVGTANSRLFAQSALPQWKPWTGSP